MTRGADRTLLAEIDNIEIAVEVSGGPFDAGRVFARRRGLDTFE